MLCRHECPNCGIEYELKLEMLSIYEQEPVIPAHIIKLIQNSLIGDNQE